MDSAGFRFVRGEGSRINGLDAFIGEYQGQVQDLGQVTTRAAHVAYDGKVYIVAGLAAPAAFQQADAAFLASIRSFRSMTAAEAENGRPNRVDFYVVRAGDTWASIAERSGGGHVSVAYDATFGFPTRIEIGTLANDAGTEYALGAFRPL